MVHRERARGLTPPIPGKYDWPGLEIGTYVRYLIAGPGTR